MLPSIAGLILFIFHNTVIISLKKYIQIFCIGQCRCSIRRFFWINLTSQNLVFEISCKFIKFKTERVFFVGGKFASAVNIEYRMSLGIKPSIKKHKSTEQKKNNFFVRVNINFNTLSFSKAEERIKERIIIDELKHKQRKLLIQSEMQNEYTSLSYLMISLLLNTIFPQILY